MPYIKKMIYLPDRIEVEKTYSGRYGKRIEHGPKVKPTADEVKKVNERNTIKKLRRLMMNNFTSDDWHLTLTYHKSNRPSVDEAKKYLREFITKMRTGYKKAGVPFKWIAVTEYEGHAIHHHLVINNMPETVHLVRALWQKGQPNFTGLHNNNDYETLAAYFVKETSKTRDKGGRSYSCSRNLVPPVIKTKVIYADSWKKDPQLPRKGNWYITNLVSDVSKVTGYPYQYYTLMMMPEPSEGRRKRE